MKLLPILLATEQFASEKLSNLPDRLCYHNLTHTKRVVKASIEIGVAENLSEIELILLQIAAWFHDVGYSEQYKNHEHASIKIALTFLSKKELDPGYLDIIEDCIMATELGVIPKSKLAKVICDADMAHFTQPDYWEGNRLLRKELASEYQTQFTDIQWLQQNLYFLKSHKYCTQYGERVLTKAQNKIIAENERFCAKKD